MIDISIRIAIASKDGKVVSEHFGHCNRFSIVEVCKEGWNFIEFKLVNPPCHEGDHNLDALNQVAELLQGCRYVLVSQIGFGAQQILEKYQIEVKIHRGLVLDWIEEFQTLLKLQKPNEPGFDE